MSNIVKVASNSHWYLKDGTPFYEVENAAKTKELGEPVMRPATLRDARKVGAFPSVTNALSNWAKPVLESWKIEQAILSAVTIPDEKKEGMNPEEVAKMIANEAGEEAKQAAKLGDIMHNSLEKWLWENESPKDPAIAKLLDPCFAWLEEHVCEVFACEERVVHPTQGYAGKLDARVKIAQGQLFDEIEQILEDESFIWDGTAIIDFKNRRKPDTYDEDGMQLAAYLEAEPPARPEFEEAGISISVVNNSVEPSDPLIHIWTHQEHQKFYRAFIYILNAWKILKNYDPCAA